jgi:uncharacterized damage-inducible protein DinB
MAIKDSLLPEYDHEMGTTRRLLERVPDAEFDWKPHDKSMSLGQLAGHIATIPYWCTATIATSVLDLESVGDEARPKPPASTAAMLADFDARVAAARAALTNCHDADMLAPWTLKSGAHEIFTLPRVAAIRSFVMNHMIHHRGQLSVYLRLKNVPLPSIYGPTADER